MVAIKYESFLKENVILKAKTPEQKEEFQNNFMRKSSIIEFTQFPLTHKGKKESSATKKSSRRSSDIEPLHQYEEHMGKPKINDEILENDPSSLKSDRRTISISKGETKKALFEQFLLIGIDKNEFLEIESNNLASKGYHTPHIMFQYPKHNDLNESEKSLFFTKNI